MILFAPDAIGDIERLRTFLDQVNPQAAQRAMEKIWAAIGRLQDLPDLGVQTADSNLRQIVIRFGSSGYIVRYSVVSETDDILVLRIWHGREART